MAMADFPSFESRVYPPYLPEDRQALVSYLQGKGLQWEDDIEFSVACLVEGAMVGTGSLSGRVIKCLAVDETLRGEGLAASMVSRLEAIAATRGVANPFVFTLPKNLDLFSSMGYRVIGEVPGAVVLLEKGKGIERWKRELERLSSLALAQAGKGPVSALVMNCNPITRGHLHLIRTAAAASAWVFLFVVAEDASVFPTEVRLRLVREETASIPKVTVVPGTEYIVSRATFPSYFLKDCPSPIAETHARLDASVFARHIAPAVGATWRFIGEEPYSPVTAIYNRVMQEELPRQGIKVIEIPRLAMEGEPVSASSVRRHLREGDREAALRLVPPATAAYLASNEAASVIARIVSGNGRH
jgi:[citrate (pro-3S)-lyase] ligase